MYKSVIDSRMSEILLLAAVELCADTLFHFLLISLLFSSMICFGIFLAEQLSYARHWLFLYMPCGYPHCFNQTFFFWNTEGLWAALQEDQLFTLQAHFISLSCIISRYFVCLKGGSSLMWKASIQIFRYFYIGAYWKALQECLEIFSSNGCFSNGVGLGALAIPSPPPPCFKVSSQ